MFRVFIGLLYSYYGIMESGKWCYVFIWTNTSPTLGFTTIKGCCSVVLINSDLPQLISRRSLRRPLSSGSTPALPRTSDCRPDHPDPPSPRRALPLTGHHSSLQPVDQPGRISPFTFFPVCAMPVLGFSGWTIDDRWCRVRRWDMNFSWNLRSGTCHHLPSEPLDVCLFSLLIANRNAYWSVVMNPLNSSHTCR